MQEWVHYLSLGAATGLLAGLFGVGGGLIIVPALVFIWTAAQPSIPAEALMHVAIGTSLAAIVPTSIASIWGHQRRGAILWSVWRRLGPAIVLGTLGGAWFAAQLDTTVLRYVFAIFMLTMSLQIAFGLMPRVAHGAGHLERGLAGIAGSVIGFVSALVGIGGGSLTTPFLLARGIAIRNAIATSAACGLPIALAGSAGYILMGTVGAHHLPEAASGYVYWPAMLAIGASSMLTAPLGAQLTHILPVGLLKRLFALLLAVVAVRLLT
ncbi:MAG: sulfite exporter TauE/SafE family protein [Gammaproteobacteria bacterium]|jgi:uncharacterized membrane protein YfcA|nr:sulfite exporter TauE/SafE family protein [Gammaproteobacteria bacterium]